MNDFLQLTRTTWESHTKPDNADGIMRALRQAGLPLAHADVEGEEESSNSAIVCIASVKENMIHGLIATPTGLVYRLEPEGLEEHFWRFACQYYYLVTGNMADRARMAELSGADLKPIKGRTLDRSKGETLSGWSLDDLLSRLGYDSTQVSLF